jgi:hypothetical protein
MFAKACAIARNYTLPIIISHRNAKGDCSAGIGTFVVINEEGWFVTAFHVISQIDKLIKGNEDYKGLLLKREKIENDSTLLPHTKKKALNALKIDPNSIDNFSVFMGWTGVGIGVVHAIPDIDLAIGQLTNFDKTKVKDYPHFKDSSKPMEQGTSLCKLGFPFHNIKPTFQEGKGFELPAGSFPIPIFPIEGIFTRKININIPDAPPYPLMFIETSSPGLRGQSGGPTFDITGTIWAIQSQTRHFKLGFGSNNPTNQNNKEAEHLRNQYLNVGWGIHAQTITGFLNEKNIKFQLSAY